MEDRARELLYVSVGLGVLGLQRWLSVRADVEAELERAGLAPVAAVSRQVGELVTTGLTRLIAGPAGSAGTAGHN